MLARVAASGPAVAEAGAAAVADAVLSDRELEVAQCMIKGMSNRAIAKRLFISEATVKFHLRNINQKLGTSNRTEAAFICQERGWLGD
jgi:LuxR family maltose regulon positive regulatory protein